MIETLFQRIAGGGRSAIVCVVLATVLCGGVPGPAVAQTGDSGALATSVLSGSPQAQEALHHHFFGDNAPPAELVKRAVALMRQVKEQGAAAEPAEVLGAVNEIIRAATDALTQTPVMQLAIDSGFTPRRAVLAWDLGPPDSPLAAGFEPVVPGDGRIAGTNQPRRVPGIHSLLDDGIAGINRIVLPLPGGHFYRIILITRAVGQADLSDQPFGNEVIVGGVRVRVRHPAPENWLKVAVLSNRGRQLVSGAESDRNMLFGTIGEREAGIARTQRGGVLVLDGRPVDGRLVVELHGTRPSYLTGLLVERQSDESELVLSREALTYLIPAELRLALEAELLAAAAEIVQDISPKAGPPPIPPPPVSPS